ncbi:MAG: hypothetical protein OEZ37_10905, partial [Gemmatimonadota bacterium]|nr:hypothetical protein [Gemmatimonadota bacterium]
MSQQTRTALRELQDLDTRILETQKEIQSFDPLFEEIEEPALALESEVNTTRTRLQEMRVEERRLTVSAEEKTVRAEKLEERMNSVRNLREEAAVSSELDMIRRALQSDQQEAYTLLDQVRKLEERLAEAEAGLAEAQGQLAPRRQELLDQRAEVQRKLERLNEERDAFAGGIDARELELYNAIRRGGSRAAVAALTDDGACSNCYGVVPLQLQNEVR